MNFGADTGSFSSRLSPQFELDLLQERMESMLDDNITHYQCQKIAQKIQSKGDLPFECRKHPDIIQSLQRKNGKSDDNVIAFEGMRAGSAAAARAARAKGQLHHAQMQRRLTQTRCFSKSGST